MFWRWAAIPMMIIINPCAKILAQERDSIFLTTGQVLIGEVRDGQMGEITIDEIVFKMMDVKLYRIKKMKTYRRFKIEMLSKEIYYGVMKESERDGWINIALDDGDTIHTPVVDINLIISMEKKFFKQLHGNLSAGFSYTKSSDLGQINLSSTVRYVTKLFDYQLAASAIESIDSSKLSRDREDAGLFVAYTFKPAWFIASSVSYQRNLELSIASRIQEMIGGGNKVFLKKDWQLLAISGLVFNVEKSTSGTNSGLLLEIPLIVKFDFFKYRRPDIQINSTQSLFFGLTQKGRVRYDSNTSFSWQLVRYFYFTFSPYANFDSQPPQGNSNFDFGVAVSLSYKF
ncbi:MAG TPA: DUF481 domain-containing protein [Chitinophagaceae bacterium]|nr:DUF481 domain-containing protein [Chitinophagaceae bacterium]